MKIFEQDIDGFKCTTIYIHELHQYKVTVEYKDKKKEEYFPATYIPTFGPDVCDVREMESIAEKLAVEIEKELGIK